MMSKENDGGNSTTKGGELGIEWGRQREKKEGKVMENEEMFSKAHYLFFHLC